MPCSGFSRERDVDEFFNLTGASMNRVRSPTPTARARVPVTSTTPRSAREPKMEKLKLIDLYNFEDPRNDNSKYVLTSPRSLEACSRLNLKPMEILYKPLIEFQEELVPRGIPMKTIYSIYEEHEKERLNKLDICREERERIVEDENAGYDIYTSPLFSLSARLAKEHAVMGSTRPKANAVTFEDLEDPLYSSPQTILSEDTDVGSLHRKRTAWTTLVGHERVTQQELNHRAREMIETSRKSKVISTAAKRPKKSVLINAPPGGKKSLTKKQKARASRIGFYFVH